MSNIILTENGNCPVTPVISMLQGKWKLQIICELCIKAPMRFGELKKMLGNVTNTALTNALRELEENELIHREQFNEIPPHVEYSHTDKGKDLLPVFNVIANGGLKYIS
ncbi:MAG TPA: helix-turn-helix domain-containing protein [Lachnospiraceae bacterium]|nr:helix-turn-helix domain-containing protein [Lachnospiraceae bacterium]